MKEIVKETQPIPSAQRPKKKFITYQPIELDEETNEEILGSVYKFRKPTYKEWEIVQKIMTDSQARGALDFSGAAKTLLSTCIVQGSFEEMINEYPLSLMTVFGEIQGLLGGNAVIKKTTE